MSSQTVVLKVGMSCQGCVGAVKRVLGKMEGVESFDINIEEQKVTVKGNVQPDEVLQTVTKTGKKTSFWESEAPPPPPPAQPESVPSAQALEEPPKQPESGPPAQPSAEPPAQPKPEPSTAVATA
ncbi:PREDICTED: copper transport protein ATX1-like isoform X2 [Ipomoea nil]|uniref:copper transport protein ATX1-like isoform X2 n=1 Tax=Ipomoea nil TaxID=35883 RepID=UPI00090095D6|nr:PREDICTED: copper transport protein ATX1-like isoform X2 [Ipomoea nil]